MKTDFKKDDVLNRRQKERPLQLGIHDISLARYFTIGEQSFRYNLRKQPYRDDYVVHIDNDGVRECIGYATPDRNKIIISVRKHGLDFSTRIPLSQIKIYGKN